MTAIKWFNIFISKPFKIFYDSAYAAPNMAQEPSEMKTQKTGKSEYFMLWFDEEWTVM